MTLNLIISEALGWTAVVWVASSWLDLLLSRSFILSLTEKHKIFSLIYRVLSCSKCRTFWATLILSQSIAVAAVAALFAFILSFIDEKTETVL